MATWRYFTTDLLTGAVLEEVRLRKPKLRLELNQPGTLTAEVVLAEEMATSSTTHARKASILLDATEPDRTAIYAERDGVIVWGGIIWTRLYRRSKRTLSISAGTFESYYDRRRLNTDVSEVGVDQLTIFRDLAALCAGEDGGDIGITIEFATTGQNAATSGVARDRTYNAYERPTFLHLMENLSAVQNGFDWAIDVGYSAGVLTKTLNLSYPRRGRRVASSGLVFSSDTNLLDYEARDRGDTTTNRVFGIGEGDGSDMLQATSARADAIDAGYPLLDGLLTNKDVKEFATLAGQTQRQVDELAYPPLELSITVRGDVSPAIGEWIIGDDVRIIIAPDDRFPFGLDTFYRIIAADISPGDNGEETVALTIQEAE